YAKDSNSLSLSLDRLWLATVADPLQAHQFPQAVRLAVRAIRCRDTIFSDSRWFERKLAIPRMPATFPAAPVLLQPAQLLDGQRRRSESPALRFPWPRLHIATSAATG